MIKKRLRYISIKYDKCHGIISNINQSLFLALLLPFSHQSRNWNPVQRMKWCLYPRSKGQRHGHRSPFLSPSHSDHRTQCLRTVQTKCCQESQQDRQLSCHGVLALELCFWIWAIDPAYYRVFFSYSTLVLPEFQLNPRFRKNWRKSLIDMTSLTFTNGQLSCSKNYRLGIIVV